MLAINPVGSKHRVPFNEQTNQAYTHGLEQIYALETIDPSKIKKIELPKSVEKEMIPVGFSHREDLWNGQYQLDLGDEYRGWMPPIFLKEPVQMLGLSQRAEMVCLDRGAERLMDLISLDFNDWIGEKGVGQGHIDEIQQKLRQYIDGRSLERSFYIEWKALLRSLTVGMERKKVHLLLQSFDLEWILPLTPVERMETLNLQDQTKKIWQNEALCALQCFEKTSYVKEMLRQISSVFLSPWIRARGGVARLCEAAERTERVSQEREIVPRVMRFLQNIYGFKKHPLVEFLDEVEEELYCPDRYTAEAYFAICQRAQSYFYHEGVIYLFKELTSLLAREFGAAWEGFPELLVEASLKKSCCFQVRKGESGQLVIYRASCLSMQASHIPHALPAEGL
ncbi:putative uncharacterized protein [Waddlia chondrophila 2032/99]|uniref:Uncharacterized protein n=2 Tax=Waddlia chondrophila TaxID=71667 RepID=D6YWU0_WADCW|nr:hypothetical protein [Waddlia chondrophila]ADI38601.1 hypothetical protein wcw_1244 [Waddlia chondrophila WSU 86-1044]CCB91696.1 putative uncharacterized protein [Waddlia chondrophila 2032/99]